MVSSLNGYGIDKVYGTYYNRQGDNKNISNNYANNYKLNQLRQDTVSFSGNKSFDYSIDDGKISTGDKAKNFAKGLISPITNMFSSPKNFLIGAGMIAGGVALTIATGGTIAPLFVAAGVTGGAIQLGKGIYNASNATTDAEAEAAWQGMGAGTTAIGLSVAGAKSALKGAGVETEGLNLFSATVECFKQSPKALSKTVNMFASGEAAANLGLKSNKTAKTEAEQPKTEVKKEPEVKQEPKAESEVKQQTEQSKMTSEEIQQEALKRIEQEVQAKQKAELAQKEYNRKFEENLSNKSAKESADVFTEEYNAQIKKEVLARIEQENRIKAAQEFQDAQIEKMQNPSGMSTAEKQELVKSLETKIQKEELRALKHENADKALAMVMDNYKKAQELKIQYDANPSKKLAEEILNLVEPDTQDMIFKSLDTHYAWGDVNHVRRNALSEVTDFWYDFRNSLYDTTETIEGIPTMGWGRGIEGCWMG